VCDNATENDGYLRVDFGVTGRRFGSAAVRDLREGTRIKLIERTKADKTKWSTSLDAIVRLSATSA
jgi:hypothetical protein